MKQSYETLFYRLRLRKSFLLTLTGILVFFLILMPSFWVWQQSVMTRSVFRDAKNVVRNLELLSIRYIGFHEPVLDSERRSGMSYSAEERVRNFSGAEGDFFLIGWDEEHGEVLELIYIDGPIIARYVRSGAEAEWKMYRGGRTYKVKKQEVLKGDFS